MRICRFAAAVLLLIPFAACTRQDSGTRNRTADQPKTKVEVDADTAARKVGAGAYEVTQKTKEAAKKAAIELKRAGSEAKQGWNDAKEKAREKRTDER